jgi:hypothetical protein
MQKAAAISTVSWISRSVAPKPPGAFHVVGLDVLAAALDFARDRQQGFELVRNRRSLRVLLHIQDELLVAAKVISRHRAMNGLAEKAIVPRGNVCGDQFPLAGRQRTGPRSRISASSFKGLAVSGRKAMGPRIPGSPSGSLI